MEFWIAFGVFFTFLILESIVSLIFIQGCKKSHRELWVHAGKPTLKGNGDLISAWSLNKYLLFKHYQTISTPSAVAFARKYRLPFVTTYIGACLSALGFVSVIYNYGVPS